MAHQSLRLITPALLATFLALAAQALAADPFSHRLHLGVVPECTACHVNAEGTERGMKASPAVCERCHDDVAVKDPEPTNLRGFRHSQHLAMGNLAPLIAAAIDSGRYLSPAGDLRQKLNTDNACLACHRGIRESEAITKVVYPQMADCLVCHSEVEPPFTCGTCHAPGAALMPESHGVGFIDSHSNPALAKQSCAVCHGRDFHCAGCH